MVPPEQQTQYQADNSACQDEIGANLPGEPLSPAFAKKQYERTEQLRECLIAHGYDPPVMPSYQQYEDDLLVKGMIYDLAYLTGLDSTHPLRTECKDPMQTWGRD